MLKIQSLSKRFGGIQVIDGLDLEIKAGTIHSIIGPNGAGKTTLFNLISGLYKPDAGEIRWNHTLLNSLKPYQIARLGISRSFQNIRLFQHMSVLENMRMGQSMRISSGLSSLVPFIHSKKRRKLDEELEQIIQMMRFDAKKHLLASELSYGEQKRLEIGRAICTGSKLILLDEPAAGLNPEESLQLNDLILQIRDSGVTVLLIEHDMSVVMKISDEITVINFGRKIAEGKPHEVRCHPAVLEAYLGQEESVDGQTA
jgi:branched-chain amino acid transport system ATP-binding protein